MNEQKGIVASKDDEIAAKLLSPLTQYSVFILLHMALRVRNISRLEYEIEHWKEQEAAFVELRHQHSDLQSEMEALKVKLSRAAAPNPASSTSSYSSLPSTNSSSSSSAHSTPPSMGIARQSHDHLRYTPTLPPAPANMSASMSPVKGPPAKDPVQRVGQLFCFSSLFYFSILLPDRSKSEDEVAFWRKLAEDREESMQDMGTRMIEMKEHLDHLQLQLRRFSVKVAGTTQAGTSTRNRAPGNWLQAMVCVCVCVCVIFVSSDFHPSSSLCSKRIPPMGC